MVFSICFTRRRVGDKMVSVAHVYDGEGRKVFVAQCERHLLVEFIERMKMCGYIRSWLSRSGNTIYIDGENARYAVRKIVIFLANAMCVKDQALLTDLMSVIHNLGMVEEFFWYAKIHEALEEDGYRGVCRVAKAFRVLHKLE